MKRSLRNLLAGLLIEAFRDGEARLAIAWLRRYLAMVGRRATAQVSLRALLADPPQPPHASWRHVKSGLSRLMGPGRLLRLRNSSTGVLRKRGIPLRAMASRWVIEPQPDVLAALPEVRTRVRAYARVLDRLRVTQQGRRRDPKRRAMGEAAACFNAGLFFEAHEHLEHYWTAQPKGPVKQFLQGIIQIAVGFHHACRGSYDGAVNQLTKGLEKTRESLGEPLGLGLDVFRSNVVAIRDAIVTRGREGMKPLRLADIPKMHVRP